MHPTGLWATMALGNEKCSPVTSQVGLRPSSKYLHYYDLALLLFLFFLYVTVSRMEFVTCGFPD